MHIRWREGDISQGWDFEFAAVGIELAEAPSSGVLVIGVQAIILGFKIGKIRLSMAFGAIKPV